MHLWSILPSRRLLASLVAGLALLTSIVPVMGAPASDLGSLDVGRSIFCVDHGQSLEAAV